MSTIAPQPQWPLERHNSLGVRSIAEFGLVARSAAELIAAANWAAERELPLTLLGGGTNVILAPRLAGLVVIVASRGLTVSRQRESALITANGLSMACLAAITACPVPQGLTRSGGRVKPAGRSSGSWITKL
mgnify:CR=1 FL=1